MTFRPLPVLTLVTLPALALLLWLGAWQWGRMGEKAEAMAAWESREISASVSIEDAFCGVGRDVTDAQVLPLGAPTGQVIRFQGRSLAGDPGWRLMRAVALPDCHQETPAGLILVQTGFETVSGEQLAAPERLRVSPPPTAGLFSARNDVANRQFFRFDAEQIAQALAAGPVHGELWLVAAGDGLPPELASVPPGQHLGYALTWWGMALALMAVYAVLHVQQGRLRFTRR